jgi:hypothetical protein
MNELELEELYNAVEESKDLTVTIRQVIKYREECYREDLVFECSGFIQNLINVAE